MDSLSNTEWAASGSRVVVPLGSLSIRDLIVLCFRPIKTRPDGVFWVHYKDVDDAREVELGREIIQKRLED